MYKRQVKCCLGFLERLSDCEHTEVLHENYLRLEASAGLKLCESGFYTVSRRFLDEERFSLAVYDVVGSCLLYTSSTREASKTPLNISVLSQAVRASTTYSCTLP